MTPAPARTSATFRNDLSELRRMSEWFRDFAVGQRIEKETSLDFELCLNEVLTNVICYAFPAGGTRQIRVLLERDSRGLVATVEDDGIPFNPLEVAPRPAAANLEQVGVGGWGIGLVRALLDSVHYDRDGGRNRLILISGPGAKR